VPTQANGRAFLACRLGCILGCTARCEGCISRRGVSASCSRCWHVGCSRGLGAGELQLRLRVQGNSSSGSEFAVAWISFSCIYVVARAPSICRLALASDCQRVSNPRPSEPWDGCALPKGTGTPLPGEGRNVARSERIYRTPETNATMNSGMLRLIARRRYCRVIRACAMHTHDGEVESDGYEQPAQLEMHPDIRAWCLCQGAPQIWYEMRYAVECLANVPYDSRFSGGNLSCLRCCRAACISASTGARWYASSETVGPCPWRSCQPRELACTHRIGRRCTGSGSSP
jgi:hypothetical protein